MDTKTSFHALVSELEYAEFYNSYWNQNNMIWSKFTYFRSWFIFVLFQAYIHNDDHSIDLDYLYVAQLKHV